MSQIVFSVSVRPQSFSSKVMQPIGNRLTALPAEIGNLDQLQEIYLTSNQLTELLVKLERLTGLRKLVVAANSFSYGETGGTQKTVSQTES